MAKRARIRCINKTPRDNRYEAITHFGFEANGMFYRFTLEDMLNLIDDGWTFYTEEGGHVREVRAYHYRGSTTRFLRTDPDKDTTDNLLSLDECPIG
ncbi:DUF3892 domain-containing protein [Flavisphingopyxis soli]|nr:DUF3892 domain-containing protein [Sphingorhabdus soli]